MRLTFDIDEEDHEILVTCIPHGMRKYVYKALICGFVMDLKKRPMQVMTALIEKQLDFAGMAVNGVDNGLEEREGKSLNYGPRRGPIFDHAGEITATRQREAEDKAEEIHEASPEST